MRFIKRIRDRIALIRGRERNDRLTLILFLGLAAAVVIVSLLMSGSGRRGTISFQNGDRPDLGQILPAGAVTAADPAVELPDEPKPAYAVGYTLGRDVDVALIVWDTTTSRFIVVADRNFGTVKEGITLQVPSLSLQNLGPGASPAIMVRTAVTDEATGVFFLARNGRALDYIQMRDGLGQVAPAFFLDGKQPAESDGTTTWQDESAVAFEDVNEDGWNEAVLTARAYGSQRSVSVSVYVWRDGMLDFDKDLSKAMTTDAAIFPSP